MFARIKKGGVDEVMKKYYSIFICALVSLMLSSLAFAASVPTVEVRKDAPPPAAPDRVIIALPMLQEGGAVSEERYRNFLKKYPNALAILPVASPEISAALATEPNLVQLASRTDIPLERRTMDRPPIYNIIPNQISAPLVAHYFLGTTRILYMDLALPYQAGRCNAQIATMSSLYGLKNVAEQESRIGVVTSLGSQSNAAEQNMLSASGGLDNLKTAYKDTANSLTNTAGVKILFIYNGIYSPYAYLTNDGRIFVSQDTSVKNDRAIVMVVSSSNELLSTTVVKM